VSGSRSAAEGWPHESGFCAAISDWVAGIAKGSQLSCSLGDAMFMRTIVAIALTVTAGCQATAGAQAEVKNTGQVNADANLSMSESTRTPQPSGSGSAPNDSMPDEHQPTNDTLLGARAGLHLAKPSAAVCQCLGVVVGNPTDARFVWEGTVPIVSPETQLVVGLSSEGLPCPAAAQDSLGASYHGYEVAGTDVVIEVETARLGRPIAQGAIVPKPPSGARVLIRPVDGKSPYGRSGDGKSASCVVWTTP
jgi:hypothetical protein